MDIFDALIYVFRRAGGALLLSAEQAKLHDVRAAEKKREKALSRVFPAGELPKSRVPLGTGTSSNGGEKTSRTSEWKKLSAHARTVLPENLRSSSAAKGRAIAVSSAYPRRSAARAAQPVSD